MGKGEVALWKVVGGEDMAPTKVQG